MPRGRRPGGADTRGEILEAARLTFVEQGYQKTTLRGVARRAGVDPALVHHYFTGKSDLFFHVFAPRFAGAPRVFMDRVAPAPREEHGRLFLEDFLAAGDSEETTAHRVLMRDFLDGPLAEPGPSQLISLPIAEILGEAGVDHALERSARAADLLVEISMSRWVFPRPPYSTMKASEIVDRHAQTMQDLLYGPLPQRV